MQTSPTKRAREAEMGEMGVGSLACTRAKNVYHKITPPSTEKRGVIVLSQSRPGVRASRRASVETPSLHKMENYERGEKLGEGAWGVVTSAVS